VTRRTSAVTMPRERSSAEQKSNDLRAIALTRALMKP
jgi:hypothetical protein